MEEKDLIQLMNNAGKMKLETSQKTDHMILSNISNVNIRSLKRAHHIHNSLKIMMSIVAVVSLSFFLYTGFISPSDLTQAEIAQIYSSFMNRVNEVHASKDVSKALSLYSEEFYSQNDKQKLTENIKNLFDNYFEIDYTPIKEKIIVKQDSALIENQFTYSAKPVDRSVQSLSYQGKEKIYLKKSDNHWKVVAWVYEENKNI
jgi:hypothetical protein